MRLIDVVPLLIGVDGNIANLRTKVGDDYMLNKAIDLIQYTRDYIAEQTIVDAVPVVRCKDCKRYFDGISGWGTCKILSERSDRLILGHQVKMPPDGFCYLGERRADNEG